MHNVPLELLLIVYDDDGNDVGNDDGDDDVDDDVNECQRGIKSMEKPQHQTKETHPDWPLVRWFKRSCSSDFIHKGEGVGGRCSWYSIRRNDVLIEVLLIAPRLKVSVVPFHRGRCLRWIYPRSICINTRTNCTNEMKEEQNNTRMNKRNEISKKKRVCCTMAQRQWNNNMNNTSITHMNVCLLWEFSRRQATQRNRNEPN